MENRKHLRGMFYFLSAIDYTSLPLTCRFLNLSHVILYIFVFLFAGKKCSFSLNMNVLCYFLSFFFFLLLSLIHI